MRVVQLWVRKARAAVGMVVMLRLFLLLPLGGVAFLLPYTTSLGVGSTEAGHASGKRVVGYVLESLETERA